MDDKIIVVSFIIVTSIQTFECENILKYFFFVLIFIVLFILLFYIHTDGTANHTDADSPPLSPQQTQQQILYRSMVSKEIVESERNHVKELQNFYTKYLTALQSSDM